MRPAPRQAALRSAATTAAAAAAERRLTNNNAESVSDDQNTKVTHAPDDENKSDDNVKGPEKENPASYEIWTYVFNRKREGFEYGYSTPFKASQVKDIHAFSAALREMRPIKYVMVRVVRSMTDSNGNTEYVVANADTFDYYFRAEKENPQANSSRKLFGVIHECKETEDFKECVRKHGFPILPPAPMST